jgi:transposase InsO family protein
MQAAALTAVPAGHPKANAPRGKRPDWPPILAYAHGVSGNWKARHAQVLDAFARGELLGAVPSYHGFWRKITAEEARAEPAKPALLPAIRAVGFPASQPGRVRPVPRTEKDPCVSALRVLKDSEDRLHQALAALDARGLADQEMLRAHKRLLKLGRRSRLSSTDAEGVLSIAERFDAQARRYADRLERESVAAVGPPVVPTLAGLLQEPAASVVPVGQLGFGEPPLRAVVGHIRDLKAEEDARVRARIVVPVLTGYWTAAAAAEHVRRYASGQSVAQEVLDHLSGADPGTYRRYLLIARRTIERWVVKIEAERARAAEAGEAPRQIWEVLLHRQPADLVRSGKVSEDDVQQLKDVFLLQVNFSKADVARFAADTLGLDVSTRHVQRILGERVSEIEHGSARGGFASDAMFRAKLFRETQEPNDTWIGDHSSLRQDHIDPAHPEHLKAVSDFDWEFDIAVERRGRQGVFERRSEGMHLTMWVDACTRRVMALRVWDRAPNALMSIASLFDAVRQYGVPKRIYTDNGSDFRSAELRRATEAAGIAHAFSRPYSPEGRGKIERMFRTIKDKVLCRLPGHRGRRHGQVWNVEDLLTAEQVEAEIWAFVDRFINRTRHSATRRCPADHYDEMVGARGIGGMVEDDGAAARFLTILPVETRVLQPFGIEWGGLPYWTESLCMLPHGAEVYVHYEPMRWKHVYLSVPDPHGALRFLGRADSYDINRPPPDIGEVRKVEGEWLRSVSAAEALRSDERRRRQIVDGSRAAGAEIAGLIAGGVEGEILAIESAPLQPAGLLASGEPGDPPSTSGSVMPGGPETGAGTLIPPPPVNRRPRRPAGIVVVSPLD